MQDIPFGRPLLGQEEREAVLEVLDGPILVHGPRASQFERDFAAWTGAPRAVSVSSCTAGMHLAYLGMGIGSGDEVIVPAQTHVATAHAVEFVGAKPVFVDAAPHDGNIDVGAIEAAITPRTKAIAVVHYLGEPADLPAVVAIAQRHGLRVVEDCALALGTRIDQAHAGLLGDVGTFSFYPVKHMTTGEGGMVITGDHDLADTIARQRAFGVDKTVAERTVPGIYDVDRLGFNYRMSEMQAALGIVQLQRLDGFLGQRRRNMDALRAALGDLAPARLLPASAGSRQSSYYCAALLLPREAASSRQRVLEALRDQGIGSSVYYPGPVPLLTWYAERYGYRRGDFPIASWLSDCSVALPVGPHLDEDDMAAVAAGVHKALEDAIR
jgi:perosamine synthetase